jgi:hypothetical protein
MARHFPLKVTLDDGQVVDVVAGQRDIAEWEVQPFGCSGLKAMDVKPVAYLRFIAWAAQRRAGVTKDPYPKWSDGVDRVDFADDAEEPDGRPDPTNPRRREGA